MLLLDLDIIVRFRKGDHEAFRSIVEHHREKLFGLAFSLLGTREDAEDVLQEAFLKAFDARKRFWGRSSIGTWLYRIVYNLCIDFLRKRARGYKETYDDSYAPSLEYPGNMLKDPLREAEKAEMLRMIQDALDDLTIEHKTTIILREVEGLSYKEIAKVMDCSRGTVMSRLHYGRKRLQEQLRSLKD